MRNSRIALLILAVLLATGETQAQGTAATETADTKHHRHGNRDHDKDGHKKRNQLFNKHHHGHRGDHAMTHGSHQHHGKKGHASTAKPEKN